MTDIGLPPTVLVSLVVTGIGLAASGGLLVSRSRARVAGALMACAGVTAVGAAGLAAAERASGPPLLLSCVLLALALMTYPQVRSDAPAAVAASAAVLLPLLLWGRHPASDDSVALVLNAVTLLHLWWRLERARGPERRALTWVLVAACAVNFVGLVLGMLAAPLPVIAFYLPSFVLIGVAAWFGTARVRPLDVRGVAASLATGVLAAVAVLAVFRLCLLVMQALGADASAPTAAGVIAVCTAFLLEPLRRRLRLVADEMLFGGRPDPLVAAGRVALGVGDDTQTALDTLRTALVLPFAQLRVDGLPSTTSGLRSEHVHREPLLADGQRIGELVVGLRAGDFSLSSADATVLSLAAPLLAQTVRARALAEGLQQSRAAVAAVREEERRRLRRDLHDGLGPRLAGIAFHADAAHLSADDPPAVASHLARVRSEAVTAMQEIRGLVQGLRPPALDEVGLVEAIRLQAGGLRGAGGRAMAVDVSSTGTPPLPAAVEVAAYRIIIEALTNSARHSGGDRAWVDMAVGDGALHLSIRDSGGGDTDWTPGVGLTSMAERAGELGGSVSLRDGEVHAVLPI